MCANADPGRAGPPGRRQVGRVRELVVAGLVDSFGLSLGWTVFNLVAVASGGLRATAMYNAAMLIGVVLAAPATAWLATRLSGRILLSGAAGVEMVLRVGTFAALLAGWPAPAVAAGVVVMHIAAWAGFAGMRAEVAAADDRPRAMTRYARAVAAVEAAGAGLAALLPIGPHGKLPAALLVGVAALYGVCLLPTLASTRHAQVRSTRTLRDMPTAPGASGSGPAAAGRGPDAGPRLPVRLLAGGGFIMLLAAGPTQLSVALATELHGQSSVAGSAAAFSTGCLLSSWAVDLVGRRHLPAVLAWPLWGIGMLAGWILAPYHVAGLFAAQLLAGLCMTAFDGGMDAQIARQTPAGTVTTALAWSSATRALGSAASVRLLPMAVAAPAIGLASGAAAATLAVGGLATWLLVRYRVPASRDAVPESATG